jgi:hypothetical protein
MKFFLEIIEQEPLNGRRRAHLLRDENKPKEGSLCKASLKLEKWLLVEQLPKDIHLCRSCDRSARKNP